MSVPVAVELTERNGHDARQPDRSGEVETFAIEGLSRFSAGVF